MAQAKKRKRFFEVEIPILKKETQLQAYEPEEIEGKTIKYDLTRILKGKNVLLYLKVKKQDEKFVAIPNKIELIHSSLTRMVRRGTDYVEDSFIADCKDYQLKIKPFMITRRKVHNSIRRALRNEAKKEIIEYLKDKKSEIIFEDILKNQLQKPLSLKLKKIYPLSMCEIRVLEIKKPLKSE
jgi:ribosomal protein S3AE